MADEPDQPFPLRDIRYLAFEGGGGSGTAYVAALQALYDALYPDEGEPSDDFSWDLDGVAGSSVGAITALMVALGYSPRAMSDLIIRDGMFAALFSEQIAVGRFCAAAAAMPGATDAPLAGHFGAPAGDKRFDPSDRAANLRAHCCPTPPPPEEASAAPEKPAAVRSPAGLGKFLLDKLDVDDLSALGKSAIGPYIGMLVSAAFATLRDLDTKDGETLADAFSAHLWEGMAAFIPGFLASRLEAGGSPLGTFAGFAVLLEEEIRKAASGASDEVKGAALLAQPAVLAVLLIVLLLGRNLEGDRGEDALSFQEGRRPRRRRDRRIVGRNNLVHYSATLLSILLHQTPFGDPPDRDTYRDFAKDTIGSPVFMLSLGRALGISGESDEQRKKAWRTLGRYCVLLLPRQFGRGFSRMLQALTADGGLWHGDRMRQVLGFVILNKVAVVGKPDPKGPADFTFAMRDVPLVTTLSRYESFVTADLFALVQRRTKAEEKLERLAARADRRRTAKRGTDRIDRKTEDAKARLDALENKIEALDLPPELEAAVGAGADLLSPAEQLRAILDWFDFATLRKLTGKDLVVTGTNITAGRPVYFRDGLTPDFPVVEAVRISGSFPLLFKPTAVAYRPSPRFAGRGRRRGGAEARDRFYRLNYCGYFIDGGFLNNHPIDAFSGARRGPGGGDEENDPQEMLLAPFRGDVIGFELTNGVPEICPFGGTFRQTKSTRGLGAVLGGMLGTFYSAGATLRFLDPGIERRIVKVPFGNLDLFDLRPDYFAVLDTHGPIYDSVTKRILGSGQEGAGADALDRMFGIFAQRGAARSEGGRGDARRNQRQWKAAHKARKRLVQAEP